MNKIKYYKDTKFTVGGYALKRMLNIFGVATPIKRVAEYFKYPQWMIEDWERVNHIPDEEAFAILEKITGEKPEDYVTEKSQAIDFILNA